MLPSQSAPLKKKLKSTVKKGSTQPDPGIFYLVIGFPQEEYEVNCLMTVKDSNLLKNMDEQLRIDWLF